MLSWLCIFQWPISHKIYSKNYSNHITRSSSHFISEWIKWCDVLIKTCPSGTRCLHFYENERWLWKGTCNVKMYLILLAIIVLIMESLVLIWQTMLDKNQPWFERFKMNQVDRERALLHPSVVIRKNLQCIWQSGLLI